MTHWPVRREEPDSDWIKYTSDEELDILMLLGQSPDVPWTEETESLVEQIAARALKRMQKEQASKEASVPTPAPTDLRSWLHWCWQQADATARDRLRTLAKALHIPVPAEPMRRTKPVPAAMRRTRPSPTDEPMRRTKPAQAASPDAIPSKPLAGIALRKQAQAVKRGGDDESKDAFMLGRRYDDESDWTPCTSLFDALHPENRGWS